MYGPVILFESYITLSVLQETVPFIDSKIEPVYHGALYPDNKGPCRRVVT